jgi:hypothetical protein
MILADNGTSWYISTTVDDRWGSTNITDIRDITGDDLEVVTTVDGSGNPIVSVSGARPLPSQAPAAALPPPAERGRRRRRRRRVRADRTRIPRAAGVAAARIIRWGCSILAGVLPWKTSGVE